MCGLETCNIFWSLLSWSILCSGVLGPMWLTPIWRAPAVSGPDVLIPTPHINPLWKSSIGVLLSATLFVFDSAAFPYWSPGITRGSLAATGLSWAKSKFIFQGGKNNQKNLSASLQGSLFPPRGLLACTVARALFLQDPDLLYSRAAEGGKKRKGVGHGEQSGEEAKEQNKKFHLFWVGWLIL